MNSHTQQEEQSLGCHVTSHKCNHMYCRCTSQHQVSALPSLLTSLHARSFHIRHSHAADTARVQLLYYAGQAPGPDQGLQVLQQLARGRAAAAP